MKKEEFQSMNEHPRTAGRKNDHMVEKPNQLAYDLQNLLVAADIGVLFLDRDLRMLRFTPKVGELFNVQTTDRGQPLATLTHRLDYNELIADAEQVLRQHIPIEREFMHGDGQWYLVRVLPYQRPEDRVEGVVISFVDITSRKQAEEALRQNEATLAAELADMKLLQRISTQLIQEDRIDKLYEQLVEAATALMRSEIGSMQMFSPETNELQLLAWRGFDPRSAAFWHSVSFDAGGTCGKAMVEGKRVIVPDIETCAFMAGTEDLEFYRLSGVRAVQSTPLVSRAGRLVGMISTHWRSVYRPHERELGLLDVLARQAADLIEQRQAEEALREFNETLEERVTERSRQVRELASRLTMAEQQERRRIAQVLHDDLQQMLYGVELKMSMIDRDLQVAELLELSESLAEACSWLGHAISRTRQLTVDLSPPILKTEGLTDMLLWLRTQMQELHGIEIDIKAMHAFPIADENLRVLLFQIVRELLFNVKKHAGVDRTEVELVEADGPEGQGHLAIHVIDAGEGFDVDAVTANSEQGGGFGLFSARERLGLLGGRLEIRSRPGEGTHIEVHVPVQSEQSQ